MVNKQDCFTCEYQNLPDNVEPCVSCPTAVYVNWKQKESPVWKQYVEAKVKEQMQSLYAAFEKVPQNCQQARFIKGLDAPKTCGICGLGPCAYGISIKGLNL